MFDCAKNIPDLQSAEGVDLCVCRYKYMQSSNIHDGFDDENTMMRNLDKLRRSKD